MITVAPRDPGKNEADLRRRSQAAPMPPMDLDDFRRGAHRLAEARRASVREYEAQIDTAANAESEYQRRKMTKIARLKAEGRSATEAIETAKGDDWVCEAQVNRDIAVDMKKAKLEAIAGIDAERASLHRVAEWSMQTERLP